MGIMSNMDKVTYGTAQGSILGPLIFIIYVNDLFNVIDEKDNVIMYADDTLLMSSAKCKAESMAASQNMLDNIMVWCDINKLTVNIKKKKCMFINPGNDPATCNLNIHGTSLDVVRHFEYLGMSLDDELSMNKHVESMVKKARCKLGILYKIRKLITHETSLLIYKVMIRPHLEYGDFLVESSNQSNIDKLERLQGKCLRLAEYQSPGKRKEMSMLKNVYGIEELGIRRQRSLLQLMYSESKHGENQVIVNYQMTLRSDHKIKLKTPFTRLTNIQRSPFYRGLALWNKLPEMIQKEPDCTKFKSKVKTYIIS